MGFELASIIEIDKQATLRLLIDPASTDSLVVRGEAALSFTMDRSGENEPHRRIQSERRQLPSVAGIDHQKEI